MATILGKLLEANLLKPSKVKTKRSAGFTLIELMIVIAIIGILMGIAAGRYDRTVTHSREAVLKQDLQVFRVAIDNYTLDKEAAPQSLDDLVTAGYLHHPLPNDPFTQKPDWQPAFDDVVLSPDQTTVGMVDVHSNSELVGSDGKPYKEW